MTCDYATLYETRFRRRHPARRAAALTLWIGLFLVRPCLAREIWRERCGA
jgi:hypothetical protein